MNHLGTITLETERLILRRFVPDDAEDAFKNWTNSETVTKYMPWQPHRTLDVTRGCIQYCIDGYKNADDYNRVIEYKENGQGIGSICDKAVRAIPREDYDNISGSEER